MFCSRGAFAFAVMVIFNQAIIGQCVEPTNSAAPPNLAMGAGSYQSMYGINMVAHGTVRALVIFAELEYSNPAEDPVPDGTLNWPAHQLPSWVDALNPSDNLLEHDETQTPPRGLLSRFMWDASGGDFRLLGDYLVMPNGGIPSIPAPPGGNVFNGAVSVLCNQLSIDPNLNGLQTYYSHNTLNDYDLWTINTSNRGMDRPPIEDLKYDHIFFIFRNANDADSGHGRSSPNSPGQLFGYGANSYTIFGARNNPPIKIMCHEFAHLLFVGEVVGLNWTGSMQV